MTSAEDSVTLAEVLADFPPGPLDLYRKKASFDWKKMKLFLTEEDLLLFRVSFRITQSNRIT